MANEQLIKEEVAMQTKRMTLRVEEMELAKKKAQAAWLEDLESKTKFTQYKKVAMRHAQQQCELEYHVNFAARAAKAKK